MNTINKNREPKKVKVKCHKEYNTKRIENQKSYNCGENIEN